MPLFYSRTEFNKEIIEEMILILNPTNFRMTFVTPEFDTETFETAPHYGTKYLLSPFDDEFIKVSKQIPLYLIDKKLSNISSISELHLPKANSFVADEFTVEKIAPVEIPAQAKILVESDQLRMWYKKDDTFHVPKAHVYLQFSSPQSYLTPLNCVLSKLVVEVMKETLNEFSYHAEVAGLEYSLDSNTDGLIVNTSIFLYDP